MTGHAHFFLPAALFLGAASLAACSDPVDPISDATLPPPGVDPVPPAYDEHPAPPLDVEPPPQITLCDPLDPADALEFSEEAVSVGALGTTEILGSRNDLICSEPYMDDHLECEIRAGGTAFLKKDDGDVSGLRNTSGAPAILAVTPLTMGCNPMSAPAVDPGRRPL